MTQFLKSPKVKLALFALAAACVYAAAQQFPLVSELVGVVCGAGGAAETAP